MTDLSAFPITQCWPAQQPDRLQLYSLPTPNGVKVSIMLEEIQLPYEAHLVNILNNENWTHELLSLNPNGKILTIIDPNRPGGAPLALFEIESKRLLGVPRRGLPVASGSWGDIYTIADISMLGWVRNLIGFYGVRTSIMTA